ncbi:MAG: hypothetical protein HYS53_02295 [Candidatus Aenigmarchaeota archaeon]|nr:hypothetical protein [Candidatus Aenigmarchaeota archaeon]
MLVAFMPRTLPEGNIFGDAENDEFKVSIGGLEKGVFKRFEYLSVPFSATGRKTKFKKILKSAEEKGTSFADQFEQDAEAVSTAGVVFEKMEAHPSFSKQLLDRLLSEAYVEDNILSGSGAEEGLESSAARVVVNWKNLADFYCIEGLVGGGGERNPFVQQNGHSLTAGALDTLETVLPSMKKKLGPDAWKSFCLRLSSLIGRDHTQIDQAADVLEKIHGIDMRISEEDIQHHLRTVDEITRAQFTTNTEIGKLYNSLIRFHNWLPLKLKRNGPEGDVYDSVCAPANRAVKLIDAGSEISKSVEKIKGATSPKGLAIASLMDEGGLGDRQKFREEVRRLETETGKSLRAGRRDFYVFDLDDPSFYTGLAGGKWKGIKLLNDAKEALGLRYKVPKGFVLSSLWVSDMLDAEGLTGLISEDIFHMEEDRRQKIEERIGAIDLSKYSQPANKRTGRLGSSLIARSSMYGEDGASNFSGTYESVPCEAGTAGGAIRTVIQSYFTREAVKSREDLGLAHVPGISVIMQERIAGQGGVIHMESGGVRLSVAETPQDAVLGRGSYSESAGLHIGTSNTPLNRVEQDLQTLYNLFGDVDLEFVISGEDVYLTQLRPKYKIPGRVEIDANAPRLKINSVQDLQNVALTQRYVVRMDFLETDDAYEGPVMDFIRANREHIIAVEGRMPSVAHIPNKIEGHFRIPYSQVR